MERGAHRTRQTKACRRVGDVGNTHSWRVPRRCALRSGLHALPDGRTHAAMREEEAGSGVAFAVRAEGHRVDAARRSVALRRKNLAASLEMRRRNETEGNEPKAVAWGIH